MNLDSILNTVRTIINQVSPSLQLTEDMFSDVCQLVNLDYFKLWCGLPEDWAPGQPVSRRGWQVSSQNTEALKTFLVDEATYSVTIAGKLTYPANFVHIDLIKFNYQGTEISVTEKDHQEIGNLLKSPILAPTSQYPIFTYYGAYLQFYPKDLANVTMSYFRLPTTPKYVIKEENGVNVYDPDNSVQFEWPEAYHNDLVKMILSYLGISSKDVNVANYAESVKAKGA